MSTPQNDPIIPTMEAPEGKLDWAKRHFAAFRDQVTLFQQLNPHTLVIEDDADASEYVFKIKGIQQTSPELGFVAGDCVHNLRSALDHLVLQLAILGQGGRELTDSEERSCAFPVYSDPSKFPDPRKAGPIKLLRPGEQTRITELQPFNAWDASIWGLSHETYKFGRMNPASIPGLLQRLVDLDNIDKHRSVHATWRAASWYQAEEPPIAHLGRMSFAGALKDETEVGRWHYGDPKPELPPDMDVNRYFPIGVAIGEPPFMYSAVELLEWLTTTVEMVLEMFRPCVEVGAAALPLSAFPDGSRHD